MLFDSCDVCVGAETAAELSKPPKDVTNTGDYVKMNAVLVDLDGPRDILFLATAVMVDKNPDSLMSRNYYSQIEDVKCLEEVSPLKLKNFLKVVSYLSTQTTSNEEKINRGMSNEIKSEIKEILIKRAGKTNPTPQPQILPSSHSFAGTDLHFGVPTRAVN